MRKATAVGVVFLAASVAFAATLLAQSQSKKHVTDTEAAHAKVLAAQITPLNMNTGLWQSKVTGKNNQVGAFSPMTTKYCVTAETLSTKEWANEITGNKCSSVTILKSTGADADVQGKGCEFAQGVMADGRAKLHLVDSGHVTGSLDMTFTGFGATGVTGATGSAVQMHADITSTWIGAKCPADVN